MQRILALDQATNTGVAWTHDLCATTRWSTTYRVPLVEHRGQRLLAFRQWLLLTIENDRPDLIAYERPHARHHGTAMVLMGMAAVILMCAAQTRTAHLEVRDTAIKKHATGKGNASKAMLVAAAAARGWTVRDDDEADALWLLDYVSAAIRDGRLKEGG